MRKRKSTQTNMLCWKTVSHSVVWDYDNQRLTFCSVLVLHHSVTQYIYTLTMSFSTKCIMIKLSQPGKLADVCDNIKYLTFSHRPTLAPKGYHLFEFPSVLMKYLYIYLLYTIALVFKGPVHPPNKTIHNFALICSAIYQLIWFYSHISKTARPHRENNQIGRFCKQFKTTYIDVYC